MYELIIKQLHFRLVLREVSYLVSFFLLTTALWSQNQGVNLLLPRLLTGSSSWQHNVSDFLRALVGRRSALTLHVWVLIRVDLETISSLGSHPVLMCLRVHSFVELLDGVVLISNIQIVFNARYSHLTASWELSSVERQMTHFFWRVWTLVIGIVLLLLPIAQVTNRPHSFELLVFMAHRALMLFWSIHISILLVFLISSCCCLVILGGEVATAEWVLSLWAVIVCIIRCRGII